MKTWFTISELAAAQGVSRQCLIWYDRIGLFRPERVDPGNGYRYYSSDQLDALDTIMMMKATGMPLEQIRKELEDYSTSSSQRTLDESIVEIDRKISALKAVRRRLVNRLDSIREATSHSAGQIVEAARDRMYLYTYPVKPPYSLNDVSLATKKCLARAKAEGADVDFITGAILPLDRLRAGRYLETTEVFLPCSGPRKGRTVTLDAGHTVSIYHVGAYERAGESYERLIAYCWEHGLEMTSPSYEFALNDYLTTRDKGEYMTRLTVYVRSCGT